jgi:GNAT superfamily N-acetyltransferase
MNDLIQPAADKLEVTITYLEMRRRPAAPGPPPVADLTILQAVRPTVSFYRYLYNTVGAQWLWWERRRLDDASLRAIIHDSAVEIYVLYAGGVPAGYAELDRRTAPEIEIAYFGIMPEYIGQRLGPYLLRWIVDRAWGYEPRRLWLHTCTLDHPKAMVTYLRAGFEKYKTEFRMINDPRAAGLM